jgi:hypothetical protein
VHVRPAVEPVIRHVIDNAKIEKIDNSMTIKAGTPNSPDC